LAAAASSSAWRNRSCTSVRYQPKATGKVDDLGRPAADLLRQLPGVVGVEVVPGDGKPARRLIHLRDWHSVPRDSVSTRRGCQPGTTAKCEPP
jgi:hypothetical protein